MDLKTQLIGKKYGNQVISIARDVDNLAGVVIIFEDEKVAAHVLPYSEAITLAEKK